jgi:capsule biosynthesis phosphatase
MRIVIDLDGTICELKDVGKTYEDLKPLEGAIERIRDLKSKGHYIIIATARNMETQQSNVGKVIKNIGLVTLGWLEKYDIPYDEIYFGKPNAHIYIDDRAFRFHNWKEIDDDLLINNYRQK